MIKKASDKVYKFINSTDFMSAVLAFIMVVVYFITLFKSGRMCIAYDTVVARLMVSGDMIGYPNAHVLLTNYVFGLILAFLYRVLPVFEWYSILLVIAVFFSLWAILYKVFAILHSKGCDPHVRILTGVMVIFLFNYFFYTEIMDIYFLNSATICGVCACLYLLICKEFRIVDTVIVGSLLVLCFGIRFDVFEEVVPFAVVAFVVRILIFGYKKYSKHLIVSLLMIFVVLFTAEKFSYTGIYKNEKETIGLRAQIQDYGQRLSFDEYEGFYADLGMDRYDYDVMMDCWGMSDHYNKETLSAIVKQYEADNYNVEDKKAQIKILIKNMFKDDYMPSFWCFLALSVLVCVCILIKKKAWKVIGCYFVVWLFAAGELLFLAYKGRFPIRVTKGPLVILIIWSIAYTAIYISEITSLLKNRWVNLVVTVVSLTCIAGIGIESGKKYLSYKENFEQNVSGELAMVQYILNDEDNVYFMHGRHDFLDMINPEKRNYTGWGGWASGTIDWKTMIQGDYDNVWDAVAYRDDLRFVVGENTVNTLLKYMEYHGYKCEAERETVSVGYNKTKYDVWRFVTKTE